MPTADFRISARIDTLVLDCPRSKLDGLKLRASLNGRTNAGRPQTTLQDVHPDDIAQLAQLGLCVVRLDLAIDAKPRNSADAPELFSDLRARWWPCDRLDPRGRRAAVLSLHGALARRIDGNGSTFYDSTSYVGSQNDPVMVRAYAKVLDDGRPLPADQHVARFECELRDPALRAIGIASTADIAGADWRLLAHLLRFRKPAPLPADGWRRPLAERALRRAGLPAAHLPDVLDSALSERFGRALTAFGKQLLKSANLQKPTLCQT